MVKYSTECSYTIVEEIADEVTGERQISDAGIQDVIVRKALKLSNEIKEEYLSNINEQMPKINDSVDIYDKTSKEVILEMDGILTKEQKENRDKVKKDKKSFVSTDIVILQNKKGSYDYIMSPIDEKGNDFIELSDCIKSKIKDEYKDNKEVLNIVAISDGASNIRKTLNMVFLFQIIIILDWYHLTKKIREFMSMIAINKNDKLLHMNFIKRHLWYGETDKVIDYLKKIKTRNIEKLKEFITYLEKHKSEIINYDKRKKAGKTIGSGLIEKTVDQIVAVRQKKKGMSWSKLGSKSLALLKMNKLKKKHEGFYAKYQVA